MAPKLAATCGRAERAGGREGAGASRCYPSSVVGDRFSQQELEGHYTLLSELGRGTYGRVVLARCQRTGYAVALKLLPKDAVRARDVLREFNLSYYLSPHPHVLATYDVAFETSTAYVFAQEHTPYGDLFEAISRRGGGAGGGGRGLAQGRGLSQEQAKAAVTQVGSALEFMHSRGLVHRDVKPENVLVFDEAITRVKLMDFGMTKRTGTTVRKVSDGIPYTPPEICRAMRGEQYPVRPAADVWALGVLLFCALTGNFPWELAHHHDPYYSDFAAWRRRVARHEGGLWLTRGGRRQPSPPPQWARFPPCLLKLLGRMLEERPERRCGLRELERHLGDDWTLGPLPSPSQDSVESADLSQLSSEPSSAARVESEPISDELMTPPPHHFRPATKGNSHLKSERASGHHKLSQTSR